MKTPSASIRSILLACALLASIALLPASAAAQTGSRSNQSPGIGIAPPSPPPPPTSDAVSEILKGGPKEWTSPERLSSSLQILLLLTVLSLAPAVLLMTTSFVRIIVVLGLLKQALGTQQLPPSQVLTTLALFMTLLVMTPTWSEVYTESIGPYTSGEIASPEEAFNAGVLPIKRFMSRQIDLAGNANDVWLFFDYLPESQRQKVPETYDEIPLQALLPAFMLSELKSAFQIGFVIFLPFLLIDIIISTILMSMGMVMVPPVMIALPVKILMFVLIDGWNLVARSLISSFN